MDIAQLRHRRSGRRVEPLENRSYLAGISFSDPKIFEVGGGPLTTPVLADFNNDGKLDAAVANTSLANGTVSILLGQGNGNFGPKTDLPAGGRPYEVVAGDFNGDQKIDLAATNGEDGTISVYLGQGNGTFAAQTLFPYGAAAVPGSSAKASLATADLNGDTKLDLVIAEDNDKAIVSLLGAGDGSFTIRQSIATDPLTNPSNLIIGDFDGDTNVDVAYNEGTTPTLHVRFGVGDGTFTSDSLFPVANTSGFSTGDGLVAGDFNNDGKTDIVMLTAPFSPSVPATMSTFLSNGDRTFQPSIDQSGQPFRFQISAADLNADGKLDVFVDSAGSFVVVAGNGDGTFATTSDVTMPNFPVDDAAAFADLNGDSTLDLVLTHFTNAVPSGYALTVFLAGEAGGGDGGGGGGGGENTATVTPTISATLPAAVVGGAKAKGAKVSVTIANTGDADLNAPVTIGLFASSDTTFDEVDTVVGVPVTKTLAIKQGAQKVVKFKVTSFPSVADGDYFLIAKTTSAGLADGTSASAATVNIAAPFVDVTGAFAPTTKTSLKRGKKGLTPVTVTNLGNIDATGTIDVALTLVASPGSELADVPVAVKPVKLKLKPGASKAAKLSFVVPADTAIGSYTLQATVDSGNALAERDETNNGVTGTSATFIVG